MHDPWDRGLNYALRRGQYSHVLNVRKSFNLFFTPQHVGKYTMPGYDDHKLLCLNCEIHGPRIRGSDCRGAIWSYSVNGHNV